MTYKNGNLTTQVDALSRLGKEVEALIVDELDEEIACFLLE